LGSATSCRAETGGQAGVCDALMDGVGTTAGAHRCGLLHHCLSGGQDRSGIGKRAGPRGWAL